MKWSLVFDSQCGERVGPSVTVPAPIPRYTENQRGPQEEATEGQLKITCSFNPTNLFSSTSPYFQCSRCTHRGLRCTDTELKLSHSILQIQ